MLSELALGPEIFRTDEYGGSAFAEVCLAQIYRPLLEDCLVRNPRAGEWHAHVLKQEERLHPKGKELLKKLESQKRLIPHPPFLAATPATDEEWENEIIGTHASAPLAGMIFGQQAKNLRHSQNSLVACPQKLSSARFWSDRPCSKRIGRSIAEYRTLLDLVLRHANWIAFVDPHLDPSDRKYLDFKQLLAPCAGRVPTPQLELHRVAWMGDGRDRRAKAAEIEQNFRQNLEPHLRQAGLKATVFLWDDFHDRFVVSNLVGLSWSNGFDVNPSPTASATVARLSRSDRDDLQREFTPNSTKHRREHQFVIG